MCRLTKTAVKKGFNLSTAHWLCELAKALGIDERRLFKSVQKLAKSGIWLEEEDWRSLAAAVDIRRHLEIVVDYIIKRAAAGVPPDRAVREVPEAARRAGVLTHIREVLSNLF